MSGYDEMMNLMDEGNKARTVAATNMNETYALVFAYIATPTLIPRLIQFIAISRRLHAPSNYEASRRRF